MARLDLDFNDSYNCRLLAGIIDCLSELWTIGQRLYNVVTNDADITELVGRIASLKVAMAEPYSRNDYFMMLRPPPTYPDFIKVMLEEVLRQKLFDTKSLLKSLKRFVFFTKR